MPEGLRGKAAMAVTVLLLIEIAFTYAVPRSEFIPHPPPLSLFPSEVGSWHGVRDVPLETEVQELLKADDTLTRYYSGPDSDLSFFVAFFKSQRAGVAPHSPKVCLPGAGWEPDHAGTIQVSVPGEKEPIPVNRYVVTRGEDRSLVLYWYQGSHRAVANEYLAKIYVVADAIRYRRSDVALVRIIIPMGSADMEQYQKKAVGFIQQSYPSLMKLLWPDIRPA
jgi:EpsI family protein